MRVLSIYFVMLAFLSLNPWLRPDSSPAIGNIAWDKIDHAAAYCLLSLLLMSATGVINSVGWFRLWYC